MKLLPKARSEEIVVQELGDEILIYDLRIHKAFNLNKTSAKIYKACDGVTTFEELKRRHKFTDDLIHMALDELKENGLITGYEMGSHFGGLTRREAIRKVGLATMVALPVITGLVAPKAADAQSACVSSGGSCTFNNFTQSNCCSGLRCGTPINTCFACLGSGASYAGAGTLSICNSDARKNSCCNSGSATTDGEFCFCP